jgi:hypothetical protein
MALSRKKSLLTIRTEEYLKLPSKRKFKGRMTVDKEGLW